MNKYRILFSLAMATLLSGCATMQGVTSFTNAGDVDNLQENETRLWHEADGADDTIHRSDQIYKSARTTKYLQKVMNKLYPEFKGKIRVQIYDSTELNAFAFPNGSIYINIGMLARIENEAQLAAILAHEATHFIEKHSLQQRVRTINYSAFAVSGIPFSTLASISSISGFSRDLEREADRLGYDRLVKAGYNPREAHKVFQHLADEVKALEIEEPFFFSSHPNLMERIEAFKQLSSNYKGKGRIGTKSYNRAIGSIRLDALRKDLGRDRYKSVILVMEDKNKRKYYPAAGYYYLGEAYYRRDEEGDDHKAINAYKKAEKKAPKYAPTYMRLGMHYMKKNKKRQAKRYFRKYLALAPRGDSNRAYVKQYLNSL